MPPTRLQTKRLKLEVVAIYRRIRDDTKTSVYDPIRKPQHPILALAHETPSIACDRH